jgi:hypothetical protein
MATYGGGPDPYTRGFRLWRDVFSATPLDNSEADQGRLAPRRATFVVGAGFLLFATGIAIGFVVVPDA